MTTSPADVIRDALAAFATASSLGRDELLDALATLGDAQAALDAVKLRVAGEVESRSTVVGPENPVQRAGHSTAAALVAERWKVPFRAAKQYCLVGEATVPRRSLIGESLQPRFSVLASALTATAGWLSVDQAAVIIRELDKAAPACSTEAVELGERLLVEHAPSLTVTELRALAGQVRDRLDQDGIAPREERQRTRRSLTIGTTRDGMTHFDWFLDPESAGYVVTAIDALVSKQIRRVRFGDPVGSAANDQDETRSMAQRRSDAALDAFRHLACCSSADAKSKPPVTVIVRVDLETLQTGVGAAEIDGIRSPISAGTVRRMAADANLIPAVLGGASQVLDLGRRLRLFSPAQKLALAERDGGCAWMGCPHPPSYTEAHHIRWWDADAGPTDLANGILLCSSHHHRVHDDGWGIDVRENVPYFLPPAHIDPHRRPRAGGRIRLPGAA